MNKKCLVGDLYSLETSYTAVLLCSNNNNMNNNN